MPPSMDDSFSVTLGSCSSSNTTVVIIIENADGSRWIMTKVVAPGGPSEMSAYRGELAGLYASIAVVNRLCNYHNMDEREITVGCDGPSALQAIFQDQEENPDDLGYDLIAAYKNELKKANVRWKYKHVAGPQDDAMDVQQLDHWAKLNVEADSMAKGFIAMAKVLPRHFCTSDEPRSLWHQGQKLFCISDAVYKIVHDREAYEYWKQKDKVLMEAVDYMNWEAISSAMKLIPRARQHFITKHTASMCGGWEIDATMQGMGNRRMSSLQKR